MSRHNSIVRIWIMTKIWIIGCELFFYTMIPYFFWTSLITHPSVKKIDVRITLNDNTIGFLHIFT